MNYLIPLCLCVLKVESATHSYFRRTDQADQNSASSGFVYHSNLQEGPVSYVYNSGPLVQSSTVAHPHTKIIHPLNNKPVESNTQEKTYNDNDEDDEIDDEIDDDDSKDSGFTIGSKNNDADKIQTDGHTFKFVQDDGENSREYSNHGAKEQTAYKSENTYDKGSQGKHNNDAHKGYYNEKNGNKQRHHKTSRHSGSKNAAAKSSRGSSNAESNDHKKGYKTTGYHKVYHKDEYKKEHTFYDESDNQGHFHKYGNLDSNHSDENGEFGKGGREDGGFQTNKKVKEGSHDTGSYDVNDSKLDKKDDETEHEHNYTKFSKGTGQSEDESGAFEEDDDEN